MTTSDIPSLATRTAVNPFRFRSWTGTVILLLLPLLATAQNQRSLDLLLGVNALAIPAYEREGIELSDRRSGPGFQFGLGVSFYNSDSSWRVPITVEYLNERGSIDDFRIARPSLRRSSGGDPTSTFAGKVRIREQRLRFRLGFHRRLFTALELQFGFAISPVLSSEHLYSYEQTTVALIDPVTGEVRPLPEPLRSRGQRTLFGGQGAYVSLPLGITYFLPRGDRRTFLSLEADLSLRRLFDTDDLYQYGGTRFLLTAGYHLYTRR